MSERADDPESVAVDQLRAMGLSAYAARTYVALVGLGEGTARDVSERVEVPRTRVYDAVEELRERGMVDVQRASPKRFCPVSVETTGRHFEREYTARVNRMREALEEIDGQPGSDEQRGVWTVTGRRAVTDRVLEFLAAAEREVVYMSVEELLTDEIVDALRTAEDRGVRVGLAPTDDAVRRRVRGAVEAVETVETSWDPTETPAGRVVLVDRERTLASVLVEDGAGGREETAIWGSGETNSLVVVLRATFAPGLDVTGD
jgi:sugar-specific transcriptional regulator TrmB